MMTTTPGTALIPTGIVTVCCGLHKRGDWGTCCTTDDDCTPCCERCPTCLMRIMGDAFDSEWDSVSHLGRLVDELLRSAP